MFYRVISRAALLFLTVVAWSSLAATETLPPQAQFKIGAIYGLTGLVPDLGEEFRRGTELYLESVSSKPHRVSLKIEDSRWDSKTAVAAFRKLVDFDGVQAVHVMGSGPCLAIKPLSESEEVLLFAAGAHPVLIPGSSLILRHANLSSEDARMLANFVGPRLDAKTILANIYIENDWGEGYNKAFQDSLRTVAPGVTIVSESHVANDADLRSILLRLIKNSPSALVINSAGPSIVTIVEQARQLGFKGTIYVNNGLALSKDAQKRLRNLKDSDIFYQRYPKVPSEYGELYSDRYNGEAEYYSLVSFTDLELLDYAVSKVGTNVGDVVRFVKQLGTFEGRFATLEISPQGDILVPTVIERFN